MSASDARAALTAAGGDAADAIDIWTRGQLPQAATPFDEADWFTGPPLTRKLVARAEQALGFTFPEAYVALLLRKNGGSTRNTCFPVARPTSWANDHICITGIRGIGGKYGIDPATEAIIAADWGYPRIGFVFAETPTAGHTVLMFDYSECGRDGNPRVVWVDTYEKPAQIMVLAADFTAFIAGLFPDMAGKPA